MVTTTLDVEGCQVQARERSCLILEEVIGHFFSDELMAKQALIFVS